MQISKPQAIDSDAGFEYFRSPDLTISMTAAGKREEIGNVTLWMDYEQDGKRTSQHVVLQPADLATLDRVRAATPKAPNLTSEERRTVAVFLDLSPAARQGVIAEMAGNPKTSGSLMAVLRYLLTA